jgi:DNA-directed RNA polymerase specialized sigma24 family protein
MNIPSGVDKDKAIKVIISVSKRLAPRYVFPGYDVEDIEQEAFIIGVTGLEKYDTSRPLENFIYTHINNRLKTFKRDNYYRLDYGSDAQKIQDRKKSLLEPVSVENIQIICSGENVSNNAQLKELLEIIDEKLPAHLRRDYLKLRANSFLPKNRKVSIIKAVEKILNGGEDEEG